MVITASNEHLAAIGRLRYSVYIEEMRRDEPDADHAARVLLDPTDRDSTVLAAFDASGNAVGTVRLQSTEQIAEFDRTFHRFNDLPEELGKVGGLTSKLIVSRAHRKGSVATRLVVAVFELAYTSGHRINMINCNPPLDTFFEKLGFVRLAESQQHPVYGTVCLMFHPMADADWLEAIRSPFSRVIDQMGRDEETAARIRDWSASIGVRYWENSARQRPRSRR